MIIINITCFIERQGKLPRVSKISFSSGSWSISSNGIPQRTQDFENLTILADVQFKFDDLGSPSTFMTFL